ncbi:sugar phosphate isomerase/epimerase family protein [Paenibacillus sp. y28]|uniref:sugar phosphate isomerase/epimerase family protein n=1 Tax=Paenibacillus sp. y28 TaxID=3129110 RepID=UPI003018AA04
MNIKREGLGEFNMILLSGYGDEISPDLDTQLDVLEQEGIRYLDLRSVGSNVFPPVSNMLALPEKEIVRMKKKIRERGFKVNSLNTSIGKYDIREPFTPQLHDLMHAICLARFFETTNVRIFSFYVPKGADPREYRDEVICRMRLMAQIAEREGITLMLENDALLYGSNGERLRDIFHSVHSPCLRLAFDPANFIQSQVLPMTDAYSYVWPYISWVQAKDAFINTGKAALIGEGDGQIRELLQRLQGKKYAGVISVESKLESTNQLEGFTRAQLFIMNVRLLKKLLREEGLSWT